MNSSNVNNRETLTGFCSVVPNCAITLSDISGIGQVQDLVVYSWARKKLRGHCPSRFGRVAADPSVVCEMEGWPYPWKPYSGADTGSYSPYLTGAIQPDYSVVDQYPLYIRKFWIEQSYLFLLFLYLFPLKRGWIVQSYNNKCFIS